MSYFIEQFYRLFQGALVFQGIFFGLIWIATRRKDIFWYALFLLTAAAYFFINATGTFFNTDENGVFESQWYGWLNIPIIILENLFYLLFIRAFFFDIITSENIKRILTLTLRSVPVLLLIFLLHRLLHWDTQFVFYTVNLLSIAPALLIVYVVIKNKLPYARLVANGLLFTIAGTVLTVIMIVLGNNHVHSFFTDYYPLFFVRCGILGDMIFYQLALLRKWQQQEKELAMQKLQNELAIEKVKTQISKELHDDIGSTLSGINMYSHMAKAQLADSNTAGAGQSLHTIQQSANEMVTKLSDIVWLTNSEKGGMINFLERIKNYVVIITQPKAIKPVFHFPGNISSVELPDELRYQVYLIIKEAVNNAVKYSGAAVIELTILEKNNTLEVTIKDDGRGFDINTVEKGNGLDNIKKRADDIGAIFSIQSVPQQGCVISLKLKITR
jgi:signal transduction histidine kinase